MARQSKSLLLFLMFTFVACTAPAPAPPAATSRPVAVSSPTPALVATPAPSLDPSLMPAPERTVALGPASLNDFYSDRLMALDDQAGRLYVSLSPSRTVVLDAETLTTIGDIPLGGTLALHPDRQRLYIGVQGQYLSNPDGTAATTPAELRMFDTTQLALLRSAIFSDTDSSAPLVAVDTVNDRLYIAHSGIYLADANTLAVSGTLSGTVPTPNGLIPNYAAVDAAVDPARRRLWVSMNNGIPGSNNGNVLSIYDLATGQLMAQDPERSVFSLMIDQTTGDAFIPRGYMATNAIVKYDAQGKRIRRLENAAGQLQVDAEHNRVYVLSADIAPGLKVLDEELNYLGFAPQPGLDPARALLADPRRDRLYLLLPNGELIVLKGHAQPGGEQTSIQPPRRQAVQWIAPAPDFNANRTVYAALAHDEYQQGRGSLFRSHDEGTTWDFADSLPVDSISSLAFGDAQTLFASTGPAAGLGGFGVYRSTDGGQTWQPAARGLSDLGIGRVLASPDFARDRTVYALASAQGLFRSVDGGDSWIALADRYAPLVDPSAKIYAVVLSPNFAQDNTLLMSLSDGSILRSLDRGEAWTRAARGLPASQLVFAPDRPTVFAVTFDQLMRSDDGGLNWSAVHNTPFQSINIGTLQVSDRFVVVLETPYGQPATLYRAPLNDLTWQALVDVPASATAIALTPDDTLFVGTTAGQVSHSRLPVVP